MANRSLPSHFRALRDGPAGRRQPQSAPPQPQRGPPQPVASAPPAPVAPMDYFQQPISGGNGANGMGNGANGNGNGMSWPQTPPVTGGSGGGGNGMSWPQTPPVTGGMGMGGMAGNGGIGYGGTGYGGYGGYGMEPQNQTYYTPDTALSDLYAAQSDTYNFGGDELSDGGYSAGGHSAAGTSSGHAANGLNGGGMGGAGDMADGGMEEELYRHPYDLDLRLYEELKQDIVRPTPPSWDTPPPANGGELGYPFDTTPYTYTSSLLDPDPPSGTESFTGDFPTYPSNYTALQPSASTKTPAVADDPEQWSNAVKLYYVEDALNTQFPTTDAGTGNPIFRPKHVALDDAGMYGASCGVCNARVVFESFEAAQVVAEWFRHGVECHSSREPAKPEPLERYLSSSSEDDSIPIATIRAQALAFDYPAADTQTWRSPSMSGDGRSSTGPSGASGISGGSVHSRKARRKHSLRTRKRKVTKERARGGATGGGRSRIYQCTFCLADFDTSGNWVRHEQDVHLVLRRWICAPHGPRDGGGLCQYCQTPTCSDRCDLTATVCSSKPEETRAFSRKDHLKQHLKVIHDTEWAKRFETWCDTTDPPTRSRCGFCGATFARWKDRMAHVAHEFRDGGKTMKEWRGSWGLSGEWTFAKLEGVTYDFFDRLDEGPELGGMGGAKKEAQREVYSFC
ncbi:hypothetical protein EDC01DRAFT_462822 [Geopyxis carbonaria]|nr:hypothetical protein EDC01DRAFT_462822 [Geopyxis carbonaria]